MAGKGILLCTYLATSIITGILAFIFNFMIIMTLFGGSGEYVMRTILFCSYYLLSAIIIYVAFSGLLFPTKKVSLEQNMSERIIATLILLALSPATWYMVYLSSNV